MTTPAYTGLQQSQIPKIALDGDRVQINAISGEWAGTSGGYQPLVDIQIATAGPFVMNTQAEIQAANQDYYAGKFGQWT